MAEFWALFAEGFFAARLGLVPASTILSASYATPDANACNKGGCPK